MRVDSGNRERLRSGLLGPLGQEVTDMLMEELDQRGLRAYVEERFAEQDRKFEKIETRLERIEERIGQLANAVVEAARPGNAVVYAVCGSTTVVALAALFQSLLNA